MSVKDEVKAEQQRMIKERMEQRKKEEAKNPTKINEKLGCGVVLFIFILFAFIWIIGNWESDNDSYDPNDWDFDGDVDVNDAEKKLDWLIENE